MQLWELEVMSALVGISWYKWRKQMAVCSEPLFAFEKIYRERYTFKIAHQLDEGEYY